MVLFLTLCSVERSRAWKPSVTEHVVAFWCGKGILLDNVRCFEVNKYVEVPGNSTHRRRDLGMPE